MRLFVAAGFLFFLLAEFGSHAMIHAYPPSNDKRSMSATERGHDDLCRTLILCSDSRRKDQQMPNLSQDLTHTALLDLRSDLCPQTSLSDNPTIPNGTGEAIFRSISPPFHPPELS